MSGRNTVQVDGDSPQTEILFTAYGAEFSDEQVTAIERILGHAQEAILRYMLTQSEPKFSDNKVTEDRTWGHGP